VHSPPITTGGAAVVLDDGLDVVGVGKVPVPLFVFARVAVQYYKQNHRFK
jgi:hypothetical protein